VFYRIILWHDLLLSLLYENTGQKKGVIIYDNTFYIHIKHSGVTLCGFLRLKRSICDDHGRDGLQLLCGHWLLPYAL
jgi:hypothetical protein